MIRFFKRFSCFSGLFLPKLVYGAIALTTFLMVYFFHGQGLTLQGIENLSWNNPVYAQRISPETIALQVYEKIPEIPKNNQYTSVNSGQIIPEHTLISRLIRYHEYIKSRPVIFRLDWKLTLADYLGYNETMREERYPGFSTLTENPFTEDVRLIRSLSRKQRNQLVDVLVSIYQPTTPESEESSDDSNPAENNSSDNNNTSPILPRRGGANLLMP
ncbi:hypothetical protein IQ215_00760 [Cyanobacterium stanieri LEGE 03274]|uniref:Uncharacterized protein n=1 Tax=Cyanobacterium stanieri LEGE 03274 TaxID=1828756 RepID=A0ABR9V003_9CHRO|nr:hypothetical protein [Cyanobacterium stanieri]MBE9221217.1 hypothetical protein [Cyanobacterium stanieri LEGE 03274]